MIGNFKNRKSMKKATVLLSLILGASSVNLSYSDTLSLPSNADNSNTKNESYALSHDDIEVLREIFATDKDTAVIFNEDSNVLESDSVTDRVEDDDSNDFNNFNDAEYVEFVEDIEAVDFYHDADNEQSQVGCMVDDGGALPEACTIDADAFSKRLNDAFSIAGNDQVELNVNEYDQEGRGEESLPPQQQTKEQYSSPNMKQSYSLTGTIKDNDADQQVLTAKSAALHSPSLSPSLSTSSVSSVSSVSSISSPSGHSAIKKSPEIIEFQNNETISLKLSATDANRIYVEHDRITDVSCPQGFCILNEYNLNEQGDVLLTLGSVARMSSAFTFYVSTESGRQFSVLAIPERNRGKTYGLKPLGGVSVKADSFEKSAPYNQLVVRVIKSMINFSETAKLEDLPDGYSVSSVDDDPESIKARQQLTQGFSLTPRQLFSGATLYGVVYVVENHNKHAIDLHAKAFYKKGMLGIALSQDRLAVGEKAFVYSLFQQGGNHV